MNHTYGKKFKDSVVKYFVMQCTKSSGSSLRATSKGEKPAPVLVYSSGAMGKNARRFMRERERLQKLQKELVAQQQTYVKLGERQSKSKEGEA